MKKLDLGIGIRIHTDVKGGPKYIRKFCFMHQLLVIAICLFCSTWLTILFLNLENAL
jgi:hypothetical protein